MERKGDDRIFIEEIRNETMVVVYVGEREEDLESWWFVRLPKE